MEKEKRNEIYGLIAAVVAENPQLNMDIKNPRKHKQADTNLLLTKRHGGITHSLERFEPGMVAKMKCGTVLVVWRDADHTGKMCRRCFP